MEGSMETREQSACNYLFCNYWTSSPNRDSTSLLRGKRAGSKIPEYITGLRKQTTNGRGPDPFVLRLLGAAFCAVIGPPRPHSRDPTTIIGGRGTWHQTVITTHGYSRACVPRPKLCV